MNERVKAALAEADRWGIEQHGDEVWPFCEWLLARDPIVNVVEIGIRRGGTCAIWHELSSGLVVGVDLRDEFSIARHVELAEAYPRFRSVLGDSHAADTRASVLRALDSASIDLLFIDGDHSAEGVRQDFDMYGPLVRAGGVIAFHDIQPHPTTLGVRDFWRDLQGAKLEWNIGGEWGGIGALKVAA